MVETIAYLSNLGLKAHKFMSLFQAATKYYEEKNEQNKKMRANEYQYFRSLYATGENCSKLLNMVYKFDDSCVSMKEYEFTIKGKNFKTSLFCDESWISLSVDLRNVKAKSIYNPQPIGYTKEVRDILIDKAPEVYARSKVLGMRLDNLPLYRLIDFSISQNNMEFCFSEGEFFDHRFESVLLDDELRNALIETKGNPMEAFNKRENLLPLRMKWMPDIKSLRDINNRFCGGGTGVTCAFARKGGDFVIPLQVRARNVSENPGQICNYPQGLHQPLIDATQELNPYWTMLREVHEEIFNGKEVQRNSGGRLKFDWYINEHPFIKFLHTNIDDVVTEIVGFGLNPLSGNYEISTLLVVLDESYYEDYGGLMLKNWEAEDVIPLSTKNTNGILKTLFEDNWVSKSLAEFIGSLLRLQEIAPGRVCLPEIDL